MSVIKIKYLENFLECIEEYQIKNPGETVGHFYLDYSTDGSSGIDLRATEDYTLQPGERKLFKLGISCQIPLGTELQIRPRSGLALKHGIGMVNSVGTIDSDYTGEIGAILINMGTEPFEIRKLDRICQMVHCPVFTSQIKRVVEIEETERGDGGYGSTGVN